MCEPMAMSMANLDPWQPCRVYANCQLGLHHAIRTDMKKFGKMICKVDINPD